MTINTEFLERHCHITYIPNLGFKVANCVQIGSVRVHWKKLRCASEISVKLDKLTKPIHKLINIKCNSVTFPSPDLLC